jgi:hypothetical protein
MPPVSASKLKRQAEKAAKKSGKATPRDTDSVNGSTAVGSTSGSTAVEDDEVGVAALKKLQLATDR